LSIAVVGGGSIGVAWTIVFARAGHPVSVFDPDAQRLELIAGEVAGRLADLEAAQLLDEPPAAIGGRVSVCPDLGRALADAVYVQECAPENLELKRALFQQLDTVASPETTLASSSSMMPASSFAGELAGRDRCLVVHPGNPPYLLPIAEVVPAPFTRDDVVQAAATLLADAGMSVVHVRKEVEGFIFNRLQGALLREAYCLVRDGVAGVEDIDRVVREGLGRRWAVVGPFETAALNAQGSIQSHAERMGSAYARMGAERGQNDPWTPDLVTRIADELERRLPREAWADRVAWRDDALIALERARRASGLFATPAGEAA
jgi:L-gulonate 3-dehydrogenase